MVYVKMTNEKGVSEVFKIQWNLDITKGQGTGKMCLL